MNYLNYKVLKNLITNNEGILRKMKLKIGYWDRLGVLIDCILSFAYYKKKNKSI